MTINNITSDYKSNKDRNSATINELAAKLKTGEYDDYTKVIDIIVILYKSLSGPSRTSTILSTILDLRNKEYNRFSYYQIIILKSIVNLLTANDNTDDYQMYYDLKTSKQIREHIFDFKVQLNPNEYPSKTTELLYLFNQIGIKQTGFLLLLLDDVLYGDM